MEEGPNWTRKEAGRGKEGRKEGRKEGGEGGTKGEEGERPLIQIDSFVSSFYHDSCLIVEFVFQFHGEQFHNYHTFIKNYVIYLFILFI